MEAPMKIRPMLAAVTFALLVSSYLAVAQPPAAQPPAAQPPAAPQPMTFFVTSVGGGNGANLGGLAGADRHCQQLATAGGAGRHGHWRAYLSGGPPRGYAPGHRRSRIPRRPGDNAKQATLAPKAAG